MRILGVVLLVAACGGPDFVGSWSGSLSLGLTCNDGSTGSSENNTTWVISDDASRLTVTPTGGTCGDFAATDEGAAARFQKKTCPLNSNGSATFGPGTLTLNGASDMLVDVEFTNQANNGDCSGNFSGTLTRE